MSNLYTRVRTAFRRIGNLLTKKPDWNPLEQPSSIRVCSQPADSHGNTLAASVPCKSQVWMQRPKTASEKNRKGDPSCYAWNQPATTPDTNQQTAKCPLVAWFLPLEYDDYDDSPGRSPFSGWLTGLKPPGELHFFLKVCTSDTHIRLKRSQTRRIWHLNPAVATCSGAPFHLAKIQETGKPRLLNQNEPNNYLNWASICTLNVRIDSYINKRQECAQNLGCRLWMILASCHIKS